VSIPLREIVPLILTAVLASIPVALPATFTLAAAIGAKGLAKVGVLPTRLSAVDEAATMDVLCVDKTGTLTQNALTVTVVQALEGFDEAHILGLAALASSDGGQDSVDVAIRSAALRHSANDLPKLTKFISFDPATKMSEAMGMGADDAVVRIVKGAFTVVAGLAVAIPDASAIANTLEAQGFRVLAVAVGPAKAMRLAGFIALSDPPRADSAEWLRNCVHSACKPLWSRVMPQLRRPSSATPWAWTDRSALPGRSLRDYIRKAPGFLPASFPKTNTTL